MITAEQARKNADKHSLDGIEDIYEAIEKASIEGKYSISWSNMLKEAVKLKLSSDGFTMTYYGNYDCRDPRESPYWTISW